MTASSNRKPGQKRFKRKLTPFLCQEMLYDFAIDQLDSERKQAIEEFLEKDRECQDLLEAIRRGLQYSDQLSATSIKPEILAQLRESENAISLGRRYSKWASWPETIRWSVTALSVSAVVAAIVALVPWQRMAFQRGKPSDTIEIAKIPNDAVDRLKDLQESNEPPVPNESDEGSGDEGFPIAAQPPGDGTQDHSGDHEDAPPTKPKQNVVSAPTPLVKAEAAKPTIIMAPAPSVVAAPGAKATPIVIMATNEGTQSVGASQDGTSEHASEKKDAKAKGFVYRAFMTLNNLEVIGPKITELIREGGGEKAGEVELGWKRGAGRYYHFSLPQDNEERLLEQLRAYGPVRLSKDPHPRIMPQGQVRFILWIESAD